MDANSAKTLVLKPRNDYKNASLLVQRQMAALPFSGQEELVVPYKEFPGPLVESLPALCSEGRIPASFLDVLIRRLNAPEPARDSWRHTHLDTADVMFYSAGRGAKIVLDARHLLFIDHRDKLEYGAVVLSNDEWDSPNDENVLELTTSELNELHLKGYIRKRGGSYSAEHKVVDKVTQFLARGKVELLEQYVQMVGIESGSDKVMPIRVDQEQYKNPVVMRPFHLDAVDSGSAVTNCHRAMCMTSIGRVIGMLPADLYKKKEG